ncbi:phosphate signaling complex protein PhoU [Brucepastera parasyntrophica]|uniref:phosphate signaling complex protein PhoU n=1 Tax=Brucepastera parasyntrophica TaxID=2880008 RepID=UPI00210ECFAB|nr:phosphate signaling complex protein PhoU [Brucepastera parasyntrophica]ULQ60667.1 phosphate signaling complex protein PhoU [Brucepastera parasyntrophica]
MNTRAGFNEKLESLRHDILRMGTTVEENLEKAMTALRNNDTDLAETVKAEDKKIDAMKLCIEDKTAGLIATQSPVARDLREMVAIFKITANLERAGDYTAHLAKAAIKLGGNPAFRLPDQLECMAGTGQEMIRAAVLAYLSQDAEAARKAAAMDDIIDREHKALVEELLRFMKKNPGLVKMAVRILNISGFLERFGDHVTNICENIIYMVESKHEELN